MASSSGWITVSLYKQYRSVSYTVNTTAENGSYIGTSRVGFLTVSSFQTINQVSGGTCYALNVYWNTEGYLP